MAGVRIIDPNLKIDDIHLGIFCFNLLSTLGTRGTQSLLIKRTQLTRRKDQGLY